MSLIVDNFAKVDYLDPSVDIYIVSLPLSRAKCQITFPAVHMEMLLFLVSQIGLF